jgi:hypothetical protein
MVCRLKRAEILTQAATTLGEKRGKKEGKADVSGVKNFLLLSTPRIYCTAGRRNLILSRSGK